MTATRLARRAVIRLSPQVADEDVIGFLQGLVTNDVAGALPVWAALLSPQGKVLFEVAPLDRYRVILQVDERDIAHVRIGQTGQLALSGLPGQTLGFSVKQITPVNTAQDGRNHFRVEAHLEHPSERLRPGMEGIGKIEVGEERLIWIWTHNLVDWLRLSTWNWLP